jgi:hypothetical protein
MASEHLVTSVEVSRLSPCKVNRVSFLNTDAAVQGVSFSHGRLPVGEAKFTVYGSIGITSQFDLGGYAFPDGFTVFPTASTVTNIIIEYEDIEWE